MLLLTYYLSGAENKFLTISRRPVRAPQKGWRDPLIIQQRPIGQQNPSRVVSMPASSRNLKTYWMITDQNGCRYEQDATCVPAQQESLPSTALRRNLSPPANLSSALPRDAPARSQPSGAAHDNKQVTLGMTFIDPTVSPVLSNTQTIFLLICTRLSKYATSLSQLPLTQPTPISFDRQLMLLLRSHYTSTRRTWPRVLFSFQTLTAIKFVQFELYRKCLVDVRKYDDIPPPDRKDEYHYSPMPAKVFPPIGSNRLMHIFNHPDHVDGETICLNRFPKRINGRLGSSANGSHAVVGWGIEFVEGRHWKKVWGIGCVVAVLSLFLGTLWSCRTGDVQGGFAIAGYVMAFLLFIMGAVHEILE